jgi:chromosome partitioning protein
MKTIAFVNQKGGVGKTSLAASIAVAAAESGESVVALDLDPQASLAAWGEQRTAAAPVVDRLGADKLAQLPQILQALEGRGFTLAVLDCPGTFSTATNLVMESIDLALVPARPTRLDIMATRPTIQALIRFQREFRFVLNQCQPVPRSTRANEAAAGLSALGSLASPLIIQRTDHQDAIAAGLGVTEFATAGKGADEIRSLWQCISDTLTPKQKALVA